MNHTVKVFSPLAQFIGLVQLIRPRQWIKNVFVLAPLLFTGSFLNPQSIAQAVVAFCLFCLASSAIYIINDLHDIESDRQHPLKKLKRPLASGLVTTPLALSLLVSLYTILLLAWLIAPNVLLVITAYTVLNLAYTFALKTQPVVDIFIIALGFVLRIYAGAVALHVPVSAWMFITTLCLALYLAAIKRRQELRQNGSESRPVLKHYSISLVDRYAEMSAMGALVFYSMFVMSSHQELVISIPIVLFGLFRYWYVVEQLEGGESPTDVLFEDWPLLATSAVWVGTCAWFLWPH